ncbi:hypothetical protein LBMAG41_31500 [Cyanobium sp.]|nr:hypothetical protein LBMAG41_31500 [Cyanobium sp.]
MLKPRSTVKSVFQLVRPTNRSGLMRFCTTGSPVPPIGIRERHWLWAWALPAAPLSKSETATTAEAQAEEQEGMAEDPEIRAS